MVMIMIKLIMDVKNFDNNRIITDELKDQVSEIINLNGRLVKIIT